MDKWEKLKTALEKEIHLLREILANLHQEEAALLINSRESLEATLQIRSHMFARLTDVRLMRMATVEQIEKEMEKKLEDLLLLFQEETCEVISMHEQLATLMEKLNAQNHRNQLLSQQGASQHEFPFFHHPAPEKKKKKTSIATYPTDDLN